MTRMVVLGLDGFSHFLLKTGACRYLKGIYEEGPSGPLESTIPISTPSAWASFQTGLCVGNHGVSGFLRFDGIKKTVPRDSRDIRATTFYEFLDASGFRCFIMNMPYTYPPKIRGDLVFSWLSGVSDIAQAVRPSTLLDRFPSLRRCKMFPEHGTTERAALLNMLEYTRAQIEVVREVVASGRYDFMFFMLPVTDWIQHMMLPMRMLQGRGSDEVEAAETILAEIDGLVELLDTQLSPDDALIIMSDHGFRYCEKTFSINDWLAQEGYIRLSFTGEDVLDRAGHAIVRGRPARRRVRLGLLANLLIGSPLARLLRPFASRLASMVLKMGEALGISVVSGCRVDEARSLAFCLEHSEFGIYVNRKLDPDRRAALRAKLVEELNALEGIRALDTTRLYEGCKMIDYLPDIYLLPGRWALVKGMAGMPILDMPMMVHDLYGILVMRGEVFEGQPERPCIVDLAPTILYLMGLPPPEGLDGRPLLECLHEDLLAKHVRRLNRRRELRFRARRLARRVRHAEGTS